MKLIYLHTDIWPSPSPGANFITYYAHSLAEAGANTELVVQKANDMSSVEEVLNDYFDLELLPNWKVSALETNERRATFYRMIEHLIRERMASENYDAIITRSISLLPIILRYKDKKSKPLIIFESHDFFSRISYIKGKGTQGWKNYFREMVYLPKIDGLICLQKTQEDLYKEIFPDIKIYHLPSGCRELKISNEKHENFTAVYVGSFNEYKGVMELLKIWKGWYDAPLLLLIGGRKQKDIALLKERIKLFGIEAKVHLIPWQKPSLLPFYLSQADIGILPLQDTFFNRYLTCPLKMFDYISAGLPIVANCLPTIESFIKNNWNGILLDGFKENDFRKTVESLQNNTELYNELRNNVYATAKNFSWKKRGLRTVEIIGDLLKQL